jgi:lysophospholipase L1-like esterase
LILGDSIAVGTKMFAPKECVSYSKGGYYTWQWNKKWGNTPLNSEIVVISLGTNDHKGVKTYDELFEMRQRVGAKNVFWVLPAGNLPAGGVSIEKIQSIVKELAAYYGDTVLPIRGLQPDGIHPSWSGYKDIVERTKE